MSNEQVSLTKQGRAIMAMREVNGTELRLVSRGLMLGSGVDEIATDLKEVKFRYGTV